MDKYRMLENIKEHSIVVTKVACLIAGGLREAGLDISITKTLAAALLHDIGKTESLKSGRDHSEIGRHICLENHFDEIAGIVAEHVVLRNYHLNGDYSEKEIIFYADKRVNHDKIVTLEERLAYILGRYGKNQEVLCRAIRLNFELCRKVEKKLFMKLEFDPDSLSDIIAHKDLIRRQRPT
jgi:putative nucleotidyltransferase with HDIG domain